MHILIIEDDTKTANYVADGLRHAGHVTTLARDGEEGLAALLRGDYDAAVLDIMLPKLDGISILKRLRVSGSRLPVIVLSARSSIEARVSGLEAGGDDYLIKPFSLTELLARIQALLRRAGSMPESTVLSVADLTMDLVTHRVTRGARRIDLQPLEYQLLEYLLRNKGRVVSKPTIMERVWDYSFDPHTNVVEARISHLRAKLTAPGEREILHTVRRFGYVIEER